MSLWEDLLSNLAKSIEECIFLIFLLFSAGQKILTQYFVSPFIQFQQNERVSLVKEACDYGSPLWSSVGRGGVAVASSKDYLYSVQVAPSPDGSGRSTCCLSGTSWLIFILPSIRCSKRAFLACQLQTVPPQVLHEVVCLHISLLMALGTARFSCYWKVALTNCKPCEGPA